MLFWLTKASQSISHLLKRLLSFGLVYWHLWIIMMLAFALNRYAVASIQSEQRELRTRYQQLQSQSQQLQAQSDQLRRQLLCWSDPRWQELVIMRHLLLFPEESEVYWLDDQPKGS